MSINTIFTKRYYCAPVINNGLIAYEVLFGSFTNAYWPICMSYNENEFQLWFESGNTAPWGSLLSQITYAIFLAYIWSFLRNGILICSKKSSISNGLNVVFTNSYILGRIFFYQYFNNLFSSICGACDFNKYDDLGKWWLVISYLTVELISLFFSFNYCLLMYAVIFGDTS